jgi:flagellar biosynthesis protein FlhA
MELAAPATNIGRLTPLLRNQDLLLPLTVVAILAVMIMPLPPFMLDLLLSLNITVSLVILLAAMYILRPLDLSAFPSILLLTTLFRLALNVASTRTILLHGSEGTQAAGHVIQAFGGFVVGGNYMVGLIVFVILVTINFMVITKGAGRIAEVAARFTLDAMPGKQMSIDADLNAGIIDDQEAKLRRQEVARESEYYGAMDGANKFVKGDAVAGILITMINIVGGLIIGVLQDNMNVADAARTYTLLTVGDGLVTQIPALVISTAAGLIVSRAGAENNLGHEISSQLLIQPRAIGLAAAVLGVLALVPGLPTVPFLILAGLAGALAYGLTQLARMRERSAQERAAAPSVTPSPERVRPLPPIDSLSLEVGYGLIPLVDVEQNGELLERIKSIRQQTAQEIGIIVPSIHIQDNMQLKPGEYVIYLKGNEITRGELMTSHFLALNPDQNAGRLEGIATREPTFGLPALWIKREARERAISLGYTVVDLATVLTTHLSDVIRRHAHELLGRQEAQQLLDHLKDSHPRVVDELVPNLLPLGGVVKVMQNLLREQVPVRDLLTIAETLADWAPMTKDTDLLTEYVRQAMARTITRQFQNPSGGLAILTLDPAVEQTIARSIQTTGHSSYLTLDPAVAHQIAQSVGRSLERLSGTESQPLLVCSSQIRSHFKKLIDRFVPNLSVISYDEILTTATIQSLGTVTLAHAD